MEEFQISDFWSSKVLNSVFYNSYLNFGIPYLKNSNFIILTLGISTFGIQIHILKFWFKFWNSKLWNSTQFREFRILEILILAAKIINFFSEKKSVANDLKWSKTWNKAIHYFSIMTPRPHMTYGHIWHGKILKSQWCKMITSYLLIQSRWN